jgi:hypothetical protein
MNNLLDAVEVIKQEMETMVKQYQAIKQLQSENKIEQGKIVTQNLTIKHQIEELKTSQERVDKQRVDLDEREKQIILKEKSSIISNRLLDEKLADFRKKTLEMTEAEKKLKSDQQELSERKQLVDQQALINKKMEETEMLKKTKIKLKEEQVDKELARLKEMQI